MTFYARRSSATAARIALSFALSAVLATSANAQTYLIDVDNLGEAVIVEQSKPAYPGGSVRRGQEGWVRMHFVVSPDGSAAEPVVIDSSGGTAFTEEALKALETWRFEAPESGAQLPNNLVSIRTRIRRGKDAPRSDFIRSYQGIMRQVVVEQTEEARRLVGETFATGGWNLYESTMLWLMVGRIEGAEGDPAGKLEAYQRALAIGTRRSLAGKDRLGLLGRIFALQDEQGFYADATRTFAQLQNRGPDSALVAELTPRAADIAALMDSAETLTASATIYNPCDCDAGKPLWSYRPERRTFSFANLNGNVRRFEARCDNERIHDDVIEGKSWTLAPEWGSCRVFVFGDDGATFDFLGHLNDSQDNGSDEAPVARSHVLD